MPVPAFMRFRHSLKGQNLVELLFTLPFFLLIVLYIIEFGRIWMTYEGAKIAAKTASHAAASFHSTTVGRTYLNEKVIVMGLDASNMSVQQVAGQHAYQTDITVTYQPFYSNLTIPTLSGPVSLFPNALEMTYTDITDVALY